MNVEKSQKLLRGGAGSDRGFAVNQNQIRLHLKDVQMPLHVNHGLAHLPPLADLRFEDADPERRYGIPIAVLFKPLRRTLGQRQASPGTARTNAEQERQASQGGS